MTNRRGRLWPVIARAASLSGIGPAAGAWWRRGAGGTWTILGYHRVGAGSGDGGPDAVRPERFKRERVVPGPRDWSLLRVAVAYL